VNREEKWRETYNK